MAPATQDTMQADHYRQPPCFGPYWPDLETEPFPTDSFDLGNSPYNPQMGNTFGNLPGVADWPTLMAGASTNAWATTNHGKHPDYNSTRWCLIPGSSRTIHHAGERWVIALRCIRARGPISSRAPIIGPLRSLRQRGDVGSVYCCPGSYQR